MSVYCGFISEQGGQIGQLSIFAGGCNIFIFPSRHILAVVHFNANSHREARECEKDKTN